MISFYKNYNIKNYNSFGLNVNVEAFVEFTRKEDIHEVLEDKLAYKKHLVIGSGSNLLFLDDFEGLIIYPAIKGIATVEEDSNWVYIEVGAGEKWDDLVDFSVKNGWGGMENLSNIPGNAGASPVQNIGAYGAEVKDSIYLVKGFFLKSGKYFEYNNSDCQFGYRNSIFKQSLKGEVVITSVVYRLLKSPVFNLEYGALKDETERLGDINVRNIRQAVINIRGSKLPDPEKIGNAGSFFKNPVVDSNLVERLKSKFNNIPVYVSGENGMLKLAAGWLIDRCGWKGYREGDAGVHKDQALVLVNYGKASGRNIFDVAQKIQNSVYDEFGVRLEPEVNII